jgi:hypothetical protein
MTAKSTSGGAGECYRRSRVIWLYIIETSIRLELLNNPMAWIDGSSMCFNWIWDQNRIKMDYEKQNSPNADNGDLHADLTASALWPEKDNFLRN